MSGLIQTVAPAGEPITLAEAKTWLRVDGTDDDVLIATLIEAARAYVETFTGRALITQQWELTLDAFPNGDRYVDGRLRESKISSIPGREIILPRAPLASVQSVKYYDTAGTLQTFSSASYFTDTRAEPGRVVLNEDYDWPETQVRPNAIIVAYTVGYGTPSQVPQVLRTALRFMVTHWFRNRSPVNIGNIVTQIPAAAEALLWQKRLPGAY